MLRSIPAHAGKPYNRPPEVGIIRVYPRPRGEARPVPGDQKEERGLSPPTRGSLYGALRGKPMDRSIPAHAGKPITSSKIKSNTQVYPRPRGEAAAVEFAAFLGIGLSPPTRGSLRLAQGP